MKNYFLLLILFTGFYSFAIDVVEFETAEQAEQFKELTEELRCPVCQNQNLADSGAGLADDLREEIYNQVSEGKTNDEIIEFMVQRYGDFIIYRPQLKPLNYLLWFGPILFLGFGLVFLFNYIQKPKNQTSELSMQEQQELKDILDKIDS